MADRFFILAMDRAPDGESVRRFDEFGRLYVDTSRLTKANVCDYIGKEIPGWQDLGLEPDKIYKLLRDPEELKKAVDTFNNQPVLSEHVPVHAWDDQGHMAELTVGSTGTDATFDGEYINNSLAVRAKGSIDGIVNNQKREISPSYRYTPDMTPGNFKGVDYDGVMRDIRCNHVALVIEGRTGPDVFVGDEQPMFKSKRALMLAGGLGGLLAPLLAADAKVNIGAALTGVSAKTLKTAKARKALADKVCGLAQPHLAADAGLDAPTVARVIDSIMASPDAPAEDEDDIPPVQRNENTGSAFDGDTVLEFLKDKLSPEDLAEITRMMGSAEDEGPSGDEDEDSKTRKDPPAMDAAMIRKHARDDARRDYQALRTAENEVRPVLGDLPAMDSAAAVYRAGLKALKVDTTGLPEAALGVTFRAVRSGISAAPAAPLAMDHASASAAQDSFSKRFPKAVRVIQG